MSENQFQVGQSVTWMWKPRGGYGWECPVKAEIVRIGRKRAQIKVQQRMRGGSDWEDVTRWVPFTSLRAKSQAGG